MAYFDLEIELKIDFWAYWESGGTCQCSPLFSLKADWSCSETRRGCGKVLLLFEAAAYPDPKSGPSSNEDHAYGKNK